MLNRYKPTKIDFLTLIEADLLTFIEDKKGVFSDQK